MLEKRNILMDKPAMTQTKIDMFCIVDGTCNGIQKVCGKLRHYIFVHIVHSAYISQFFSCGLGKILWRGLDIIFMFINRLS